MSKRNGFIFAFSALLALGAGSAQAQDDRYRKTDPTYSDGRYDDRYDDRYRSDRMYKGDIYADDDYWYGDTGHRGMNTRFRGMDRNRDGVITQAEWRGNSRSFRNQDWNGDGVLSGRELRTGASRANRRVEAVDQNRDGAISRGEWRGSRGDFNRIDINRDGYITSAEARMRYYR